MDDVSRLFDRLPVGWSSVEYAGRRYGVITRTVAANGRSEKVLADALDGSDLVSANLYRLSSEDVLRPCEMPEQKVLDFLQGHAPAADASLGTVGHLQHAIDYIELGVTDLDTTRDFYAAAFGWEFNDYGPEYAGIRGPGGTEEVGGLNAASEPVPGGPLVLLFSEDLDATVAAVLAAGGRVTRSPYAFPGGRRFHFADPSGNELGVWATS